LERQVFSDQYNLIIVDKNVRDVIIGRGDDATAANYCRAHPMLQVIANCRLQISDWKCGEIWNLQI
jgi:hypothetical protein